MLCQIKTKKKNWKSVRHHVTMLMAMVRKDMRNFASAVKQSWSKEIN